MSDELIKGMKNISLGKYERNKLYEELFNRSNIKEERDRLQKILEEYFYNEILIPSISEKDLKFFEENRLFCNGISNYTLNKHNFIDLDVYPNQEDQYQINAYLQVKLLKPIPKGINPDFSKISTEKIDALKYIILNRLEAEYQANCFLREYCDGTPRSWRFSAFNNCRTLGRLYNVNPEFYKVACELFPKKIQTATEYQSIEEAKKAEEVFDYNKEFSDLVKELGL